MTLNDLIEDILFDDSGADMLDYCIKDLLFNDSHERQLQHILELNGQSSSSKSHRRIHKDHETRYKRRNSSASKGKRKLKASKGRNAVQEELETLKRNALQKELETLKMATTWKLSLMEKKIAVKEKAIAAKEIEINMMAGNFDRSNRMTLDDLIEDIFFDDSDDDLLDYLIMEFLFDDSEKRQLQLVLELNGQSSSSKSGRRIDRDRETKLKLLDALKIATARGLSLAEDFVKLKEREIAANAKALAAKEKAFADMEKAIKAKVKEMMIKQKETSMKILDADTSMMT